MYAPLKLKGMPLVVFYITLSCFPTDQSAGADFVTAIMQVLLTV